MNFDKVIDSRRSIKEFKDKNVKWHKVLEAIDAARKAPCAGNTPIFKFLIIENEETITKLADLSDQIWIADAKIAIIVCSDNRSLENIYHERGKIYARQQAGATIENLLLKITDLGLSSCWVGAYSDELLKQLLKIPNHINIEAILPIGYAKAKAKTPRKPSLENCINWEIWGNKKRSKFKDPRA